MKNRLMNFFKEWTKMPLALGQSVIWASILITTMLTALLLQYSYIDNTQLFSTTLIVNTLSLFLGGFVTGKKSKGKGLYYGGLQGIIYTSILLLVSFLAFDSVIQINPILFTLCAFGVSALGGVIGSNIKTTPKRNKRFVPTFKQK